MQTKDGSGYLKCEVQHGQRRYRILAARTAFFMMTGEQPEMVDHINRDRNDNRFVNLRASNRTLNQANTVGRPEKHLPKGVFWERGKFTASYSNGNRKRRIGTFNNPTEAKRAYDRVMTERLGEHFNPGPAKVSIFD